MTKHDIPGLLAGFSLLFWAFTGLPLWAQLDGTDFMGFARGFVLFVAHGAALLYSANQRYG